MRYDLQVLRAFSVFLVFVYHLDIGHFQGGFIGVDIFFVLSGYFTAQMLAQHEHNLNGVAIFLNRRLLRIVPNLLFYIAITIILVFIYYPPHLIKDFGQSIVSNIIFLPNLFFYFETDYYNDFARTAPLLHTWSLGWRFQYYFVLAILAYILAIVRINIYLVMVPLSLLSLYLSAFHINDDKTAVFYLLQYRFWELAAGYIAYAVRPYVKGTQYKTPILITSYSLLLLISYYYSAQTPFPGLTAIPIVLLTCLILLINFEVDAWGWLGEIIVAAGNRSYSIYLSHNIAIAILSTAFNHLSLISYILLVMLSTALATEVSFRAVEKNLHYNTSNLNKLYCCLGAVALIVGAIGLYFHTTNGLRAFKIAQAEETKYFLDYDKLRTSRVEFIQEQLRNSEQPFDNIKNRVLILGDSKSEDLFVLMSPLNRSDTQYRRLRLDDNCMRPPNQFIINKVCKTEHQQVLNSNLFKNASHIILSATWQKGNNSNVVEFVSYLEKINKTVAIVSTANFQDASSIALQLPNSAENKFGSLFSIRSAMIGVGNI